MVAVPVEQVDLADIDLDPRYVARIPDAHVHADYLEAFHENTYRNLSVIHLLMAKGEHDEAAARMKELRDHCDTLWTQRRNAAMEEMPA